MRFISRSTAALILALSTFILGLPEVGAASARKASGKTPRSSAAKIAGKTAAKVAKNKAPRPLAPAEFIALRAQKTLTDLMRRPVRVQNDEASSIEVEASPAKGAWLQALYDKNMIDTSWATEMLADKRIAAEVLEREMGEVKARLYYPKTLGLREFLVKKNLLDARGEINANGDRIEEALAEEFPAGFVVRPAVGIAPQETGRGLFPDTDQFIVELLKPGNPLYAANHLRQPVRSHILDAVASGEGIVLQENIVLAAHARRPLKARFFQEVRVHTYEGRVVAGAVPTRWVQSNLLNKTQIAFAEDYVAEFLAALPPALLTKQAWGVDVAVMDNGEMRISEIVTNRGKPVAWSGYLDQPRVIGAYSRHLEQYYGVRFGGWSGTLIRHNFANYLPYWEKRIEKSRAGWSKLVSYLPPIP